MDARTLRHCLIAIVCFASPAWGQVNFREAQQKLASEASGLRDKQQLLLASVPVDNVLAYEQLISLHRAAEVVRTRLDGLAGMAQMAQLIRDPSTSAAAGLVWQWRVTDWGRNIAFEAGTMSQVAQSSRTPIVQQWAWEFSAAFNSARQLLDGLTPP